MTDRALVILVALLSGIGGATIAYHATSPPPGPVVWVDYAPGGGL